MGVKPRVHVKFSKSSSNGKVDQIKTHLCMHFNDYYDKSEMTQKEFASMLGIDDALMSRILNGKHDRCTIDRLLNLIELIHPKYNVAVKLK